MKCERCGKEFERTGNGQKYCSQECRLRMNAERKRLRLMEDIGAGAVIPGDKRGCDVCGREYVAKTTKNLYCSDACREVAYKERTREEREREIRELLEGAECVQCGKIYTKSTVHQIYCSPACSKDAWKERYKKNKAWEQLERERERNTPKASPEESNAAILALSEKAINRGMSYGQYVALHEPRQSRKPKVHIPSLCDSCPDGAECSARTTCDRWRAWFTNRWARMQKPFLEIEVERGSKTDPDSEASRYYREFVIEWAKIQRAAGVIK